MRMKRLKSRREEEPPPGVDVPGCRLANLLPGRRWVPTPPTPEPVDWNQTNQEAPRNAHRRLVASEASSATPKPTAMASRQRETPPAPSRSVSLPSLKTRQPQPRSLGRQGGSNESSPPSKQLVNEKLPALPGTIDPGPPRRRTDWPPWLTVRWRRDRWVPTPTPVKPPAPTDDAAGAGFSTRGTCGEGTAEHRHRKRGLRRFQEGVRAAEGAGGAKESRREEGPTPKEARINRTKSLDGRPCPR